MAKGGAFEREVCQLLSVWWSGSSKKDDWFWRASQSGGRATVRARKGKTTVGHCGDVSPCCTRAAFLTDRITLEIKRGYNTTASAHDLLDRTSWPSDKHRKETFVGFIEQAMAAAARARTLYWAVIHRRDKRLSMIWMPVELYKHLGIEKTPYPFVKLAYKPDPPQDPPFTGHPIWVVGIRFDRFLEIDPHYISKIKRW